MLTVNQQTVLYSNVMCFFLLFFFVVFTFCFESVILKVLNTIAKSHYVKSVLIRSFFGPFFPTFGLNTERYGVSLRIPSKCGKIRTRKTPNTDTFHVVSITAENDRDFIRSGYYHLGN